MLSHRTETKFRMNEKNSIIQGDQIKSKYVLWP